MDLAIRCPHCGIRLTVDPQWIGRTVQCDECEREFTAHAEAPEPVADAPRPSRRRKPAHDDDDLLTDYEFDDHRPIRYKPQPKPNTLIPMIFGSVLVLVLFSMAIVLSYAFGFISIGSSPFGVSDTQFEIVGSEWNPVRGLTVEVIAQDDRLKIGNYLFVWKSDDGRSRGRSSIFMSGTRQKHQIAIPRGSKQSFEIWIEHHSAKGVQVVSNVLTVPSDR